MKPRLIFLALLIFGFFVLSNDYIFAHVTETSTVEIAASSAKTLILKHNGVTLDLSLLVEVFELASEYHLDGRSFDSKKMSINSVKGFLGGLDRYCHFTEPDVQKLYDDQRAGSVYGVGVILEKKKRHIVVDEVLLNSPAESAGLKIGDKIVEIDGELTKDKDIIFVAKKIGGGRSEKVNLKISRRGFDGYLSFDIKKTKIKLETIKISSVKKGKNVVGIIKINRFCDNSPDQFEKAALQLLNKKPDHLVIDLRDNPGGAVSSVDSIVSLITGPRKLIYLLESRLWKGLVLKYSESPMEKGIFSFADKPIKNIVCLINEGTASAAEIMSAALRDILSVKLIGERTYGKGTVMEPINLLSGSGTCTLTVMRWLTSKGICIDGIGLEPDIEVEMDEEDVFLKKDPQMDAAIEFLLGKKKESK